MRLLACAENPLIANSAAAPQRPILFMMTPLCKSSRLWRPERSFTQTFTLIFPIWKSCSSCTNLLYYLYDKRSAQDLDRTCGRLAGGGSGRTPANDGADPSEVRRHLSCR